MLKRIRYAVPYVIFIYAIVLLLCILVLNTSNYTRKNRVIYQPPELFSNYTIVKKIHRALDDKDCKCSDCKYLESCQGLIEKKKHLIDIKNNLSVCLATHTTVDGLSKIENLLEHWDAKLSVSVFVPGYDFYIADAIIEYMRSCSENIRKFVTFSYVFNYQKNSSAIYSNVNTDSTITSSKHNHSANCDFEIFKKFSRSNKNEEDVEYRKVYPQNLMRNVARKSCSASHTINIDIDMIPSDSLEEWTTDFLRNHDLCEKCLYIYPIYEVEDNAEKLPGYKKDLLKLIHEKKVRQFHVLSYLKSHNNTNYRKWETFVENETKDDKSILHPIYNIRKYVTYWEPIFLLHHSAPDFDERFIGYGCTRNSHVFELNAYGYKFSVMNEAFFLHRGFSAKNKSGTYPDYRTHQIKANRMLFKKFEKEIKKAAAEKKRAEKKMKKLPRH